MTKAEPTAQQRISWERQSPDWRSKPMNEAQPRAEYIEPVPIRIGRGVNYTYDGDGDRIQKSNGKLYWFGVGTQILDESDATGNITDEYIYFGGKRIAHRVASTNAIYYYAEDMLGSSRALSTSSGSLCYDADFYPFGGEHQFTNSCPQNYKFTGKERDSETNNDDFGARYSSSQFGRWISPDQTLQSAILELPQTWDKYSFVYNRPTYTTDPDGRCPPCIGAVVGGVVEGGFDLGKQFINNGYTFKGTNWREVGANILGGAVAGAIAGATGGASIVENALVGDIVAGGTSGVAGGIVTRTAEGESADDVLSLGDLSEDAVSGFVGGAGGHVAAESVHVPNEMKYPTGNDRMYRARLGKYNKRLLDINRALVGQGVRAGIASSSTTHATNGVYDWFERLWFNHLSDRPLNPHSTYRLMGAPD